MRQGSLSALKQRDAPPPGPGRRLTSVFVTQRSLMRPVNPSFQPPTDVYETENEVVVRLEIAGVDPDQIELVITDQSRTLTVSGTRTDPAAGQRRKYYNMEIECGNFARRIRLPVPVNDSEAEARYEEGFLVISLPKARPDTSIPRSVPVE